MDHDCAGCRVIAEAVEKRGFTDEYFQVFLGIFAGFLERKSRATCQLVNGGTSF
jgi:hypothetical protein